MKKNVGPTKRGSGTSNPQTGLQMGKKKTGQLMAQGSSQIPAATSSIPQSKHADNATNSLIASKMEAPKSFNAVTSSQPPIISPSSTVNLALSDFGNFVIDGMDIQNKKKGNFEDPGVSCEGGVIVPASPDVSMVPESLNSEPDRVVF